MACFDQTHSLLKVKCIKKTKEDHRAESFLCMLMVAENMLSA